MMEEINKSITDISSFLGAGLTNTTNKNICTTFVCSEIVFIYLFISGLMSKISEVVIITTILSHCCYIIIIISHKYYT